MDIRHIRYTHKKSGGVYVVVTRKVKIQIDGKWKDAVAYSKINDLSAGLFVRESKEFECKFEKEQM